MTQSKRPRGRPPWTPTDEQRETVKALASFGVPVREIARYVGVALNTLKAHCRDELERGWIEANRQVAQTLFYLATSGKDTAATIFWLKCRAGWRDSNTDEIRRAELELKRKAQEQAQPTDQQQGGLIVTPAKNLSALSADELRAEYDRRAKGET